MSRSLPVVGLALLLVSCGVGAQTPPDADQQWQQHMTEMRTMHERWMASKTPEERQAMMKAHQQAMGNGMYEMGGCMGGGKMMGVKRIIGVSCWVAWRTKLSWPYCPTWLCCGRAPGQDRSAEWCEPRLGFLGG